MKPPLDLAICDRDTYERMSAAIAFMRQHRDSPPSLQAIAQHVHLSSDRFGRLFTRWVGISPKRFSQHLAVEAAKAQMSEAGSLLELATAIGLSSPGRLHDLFVKLEAMSPGEFKAGGAGLQIEYGMYETPFGSCLIARTARGICKLHFSATRDEDTAADYLRAEWNQAELVCDRAAIRDLGDRIFSPQAFAPPPLVLHVKGTNFQIQVWRALLKIPFGGVATYRGIAEAIARPTAARAVGNAIGKNPVGYLIPCHRVIRESGELGGYRWGLERKAMLLEWEASLTQPRKEERS